MSPLQGSVTWKNPQGFGGVDVHNPIGVHQGRGGGVEHLVGLLPGDAPVHDDGVQQRGRLGRLVHPHGLRIKNLDDEKLVQPSMLMMICRGWGEAGGLLDLSTPTD